jgi:hypothetical protein
MSNSVVQAVLFRKVIHTMYVLARLATGHERGGRVARTAESWTKSPGPQAGEKVLEYSGILENAPDPPEIYRAASRAPDRLPAQER